MQLFYVAVTVLPVVAIALGLAFLIDTRRHRRRGGVMDFTQL